MNANKNVLQIDESLLPEQHLASAAIVEFVKKWIPKDRYDEAMDDMNFLLKVYDEGQDAYLSSVSTSHDE